MLRTYRVVVARPGDGGAGDRAAEVAARALRAAGFEVVDLGPAARPEVIAEACLQEDADAVGVVGAAGPAVDGALAARGLAEVHRFDLATSPDALAAALDADGG